MFVEKNKYFDKHESSHKLFYRLLGDGILIAPSNENWSRRRKSLTSAFYKDKLLKMVEVMKAFTYKRVNDWKIN